MLTEEGLQVWQTGTADAYVDLDESEIRRQMHSQLNSE